MLKTVLNTTAFLILLSVLVAGGVIRTQAIAGDLYSQDTEPTEYSTISQSESVGIETTPAIPAASGWVTLEGTVESWQDDILTIITGTGEQILIEGRGGRFLTEKSFSAATGDKITVTGFYEGDAFEVVMITSVATGISIRVRGEDGRPVWGSGGGGQ